MFKTVFNKFILFLLLFLTMLTSCSFSEKSVSGDRHYAAALQKYNSGEYESVIDYCENALLNGVDKYQPDEIYNLMGSSYQELGLLDDAMLQYEKSVEINSENFIAWTNLGIIYRKQSNMEKAVECYQKAISINPDYAEAHSSLGVIYFLQEDYEKSILEYEKAIELDSSLASAYANLSLSLAMLKRFDEADEAIKHSITLGYERADVIQEQIDALKE